MVQPSDASVLVEGLCIHANTESFCPYREVIGGCPPWFDGQRLIMVDKVHGISSETVGVSFHLWGERFVEYRQPGWGWLCCPFRQRAPEAF